ncbi:MAG TPA: sigma-70 family RNA polymerase sigma factor [Candidatus Polarisedimenticolaceae bacterium]|nr:sigma-70 family RNA polymerase sigma factor [Candidatus Polarisedimenticolaceae bacterium]
MHALTRPRPETDGAAHAAAAALFEAHHERVYRVARRITGRAEDAEDVLQTVFLRIVRREDAPIRADEAASYFHRAATNASLDLIRRRRAARSESIDDADRFSDAAPSPEAQSRGDELQAKVREALAALSPRAAEIFVLRYFDGYGNREIARMLRTSWSTVAVTLHRTRAKLQKELKGDL